MTMVLVFDMDDTLYVEMTYVKSGFKAVAAYLQEAFGISTKVSFPLMMQELETNGRGKVFNRILEANNLLTKENVKKCLSVYRLHEPKIKLNKAAKNCLSRFKNSKKYLLTDGNKIVQDHKVKALGLENLMDGIYITHRYGLHHSKPSPYCINRIAAKEKVLPREVVYIGDNPTKDFVGIKPLGYKTIRVLTGSYKDLKVADSHRADTTISGLDELTPKLIQSL